MMQVMLTMMRLQNITLMKLDISEDYEDVGDMEPDVREDYEEQDISDELSQMLDEWEEMGEAEDPEVYEYVKR